MTSSDESLARYSRQILFDKIGEDGQRQLLRARVLLVGCGALGSVLAETLVRAGVGFLRICDRDFIELNNLQRQVLFDEEDIARNLPKVEAACRKLSMINSSVEVESHPVDVNHTNIEGLAADVDLLLDGTDNFETRFLMNDVSVKHGIPWVYGAVIGATGLAMPILPGETACLRCVFEQAPPPEMNPTCDTAGVLGMTVQIVASMQAVEAIKILTGRTDEVSRRLQHLDVWEPRLVGLSVKPVHDADGTACPCCGQHRFDYLAGAMASSTSSMCGRNAVQILPPGGLRVDFARLAAKLSPSSNGEPTHNEFMLRAELDGLSLTLFPDGRAIVKGTDRPEVAKSLYAKYIGG